MLQLILDSCVFVFFVLFLNQFKIAIVFYFTAFVFFAYFFPLRFSRQCSAISFTLPWFISCFVILFGFFFLLLFTFLASLFICYVMLYYFLLCFVLIYFVSANLLKFHVCVQSIWHVISLSLSHSHLTFWLLICVMWCDVCVCRFYTLLFWFDSFHFIFAIRFIAS